MKKLLAFLGIASTLALLSPSFASAATEARRTTNAFFDGVYTVGDTSVDETSDAADRNRTPIEIFPDQDDEQYLYMGMSAQFDRAEFYTVRPARYEASKMLTWEYFDGNSWETLDIESDQTESFTVTGLKSVSWKIPTTWDKTTVQSKSYFWVRVSPRSEVVSPAVVEQMHARVYNLKLTIEDEDGDEVDDLVLADFDVSNGTDNTLYALRNAGNGEYFFALDAEGSDRNFTITIDDNRFEEKDVNVGQIGTNLMSYSIELDGDMDDNDDNNDDDDVDFSDDCDAPFTDISSHWAKTEIESLYCRGVVGGRSYYYFEPSDEVTRAEFLKMALLNADVDMRDYDANDEDFDDVDNNDWFAEFVVAGVELDIVDSDEDDFRPNETINRAEAVTMLVRLADVSTNDSSTVFTDVSSSSWYAKYVEAAYDADVVDGYTDNTFRPANELTRAEAAVMVSNAFEAWYE